MPESVIPVFFFLHHTKGTALGILAVTPLDEQTLLWTYASLHLPDHLNSVTLSANARGGLTELSDYFPYGSIRLDQKRDIARRGLDIKI